MTPRFPVYARLRAAAAEHAVPLIVGGLAVVLVALGVTAALVAGGLPPAGAPPEQAAEASPTVSSGEPAARPPTAAPAVVPTALPTPGAPTAAPGTAPSLTGRALASTWDRSTLRGDLGANYPLFYRQPRFILYYQPGTYTDEHIDETLALVNEAVKHVEATLSVTMPERFEVLVAGTLYERPNAHLRGLSISNVKQVYVLHDGTGTEADNAYFFAHELTHMIAYNTIGSPVEAVMLSEGLATWAAYPLLEAGGYTPLAALCPAISAAGMLPSMAAIETDPDAFKGHIRHPFNYFGAACFTDYLIDTYGLDAFEELYQTSAYTLVYGKSLNTLEAEWRAVLAAQKVKIDPQRLRASEIAVAESYAFIFYHYDDMQPRFYEAYLAADRARVALWMGDFDAVDQWVEQVHGILGWGR